MDDKIGLKTDSETNIESVWPLTPLQHGVLASCLAIKDKSLYVTQAIFTLSEEVDINLWRDTWQIVVNRYAALRTSFFWQRQAGPVQIIHKSLEPEITQVETAESELSACLSQQRARGFLLDRVPLCRHVLIRTEQIPVRHVWTFHHAILDGTSVELVFSEVLRLYNTSNNANVLPEPVSVKPYLVWCEHQSGQHDDFWRDYLSPWNRPTPVPGDKNPGEQTIQDKEHTFDLSQEATSALAATARNCGVTLNTIIQGIWACLLGRLGGSDEVTFGIASSGRNIDIPGIERAVGLLMNSLPMRVMLDDTQSLVAFFQELQARQQQLLGHGHISMAEMKRAANINATENLFSTMVVFENVVLPDQDVYQTHITRRRYIDRTDLAMSLLVTPGQELRFTLLHNSNRFSPAIVQHLAEALLHGFNEVIDDCSRTIENLSFGASPFTNPQRHEKNVGIPSITQQIKNCCRQYPERNAVTQGNNVISYAELDLLIDKAASNLSACENRSGPVVVCARSTPRIIAVIIGCLYAGRPYVYLDPDYPEARNIEIIRQLNDVYDNGIDVVVDDEANLPDTVPSLDVNEIMTADNRLVSKNVSPDTLAYIVFTSGSTGKPKGVLVKRSNLAYSTNVRKQFYETVPERFLLLSSLSFDSSVVGLFWTLCVGGELVLPTVGVKQQLDSLANLVSQHKITHTLCLPSVYQLMLEKSETGELDSLDAVIVAGERCPVDLYGLHQTHTSNARLFNEYGPSEATVWCSCADLDGDQSRIGIGQSIPGSHMYVVNSKCQPLPDGFDGELAVYGPGVAAGYLGDAKYTEEKFLKVNDESSFRLYRTGDLGWQENGEFYLQGRIDNQVKIRGVRIELEEIEHQLRQIPKIEDAIVIVKQFERERLLVAYVKLKDVTQSGLSKDAIKNQLRDTLPAVMQPSKIVLLEELPRNDNGKINRGALEQLDIESSDHPKPMGDVTAAARVRHLMSKIIGDDITSDSISFFDCGGTSLSVVRLVDLINDEFKQAINVTDVYQNPTAKQLATCINTKSGRDDWLSVTPIQTKGDKPPLFFAYGNAQKLSNALGDDYPVYWVVHGKHGTVVPTAPIVDLAKQHFDQIKSEQPRGPYFLGGFSVGAYVILEVARLMHQQGEEVAMLALLDPTNPQHYVVRSRWRRVLGFIQQPYPINVRIRYLIGLLRRILGKLTRRLLRSSKKAQTNITTNANVLAQNATLTSSQKLTHSEILNMVDNVMCDYQFKVYPGNADLVRLLDDSAYSLEWWDEEVFWREYFMESVTTHYIQSTGSHNDLFRDQSALEDLAEWLRSRMTK